MELNFLRPRKNWTKSTGYLSDKDFMKSLPQHLRKYIVEQNYDTYTSLEHASWRYILRKLKNFLTESAHPSYLSGLEKTGITIDSIPKISDINKKLKEFGWRALPVSGFIPPAAFMELQSLGVLPIASDMRTLEHLSYTPAPDIVHEAAGHAPMLADPDYASYLKKYSEVANKAIISKDDLKLYEAIRQLSDIKEKKDSTPEEIEKAQLELDTVGNSIKETTEASLLSRMNWWTAEYGLFGDLKSPKIFGAGLLSSVGEAKWCLSDKVKKIPISVDCINYSYDITEPQPQLFVTPDFKTLENILDQLALKLSYKQGGTESLKKALSAETVTTFEFENGLQVSGVISTLILDNDQLIYIKTTGPTQISYQFQEIPGHSIQRHTEGFGVVLGPLLNFNPLAVEAGAWVELKFENGAELNGNFVGVYEFDSQPLIYTFKNATVTYKNTLLFHPSWGEFDLALGKQVVSVFGGASDREKYGTTKDFVAARVPKIPLTEKEIRNDLAYATIRKIRESKPTPIEIETQTYPLFQNHLREFPNDWLFYLEVYEVLQKNRITSYLKAEVFEHLKSLQGQNPKFGHLIQDGLDLIAIDF